MFILFFVGCESNDATKIENEVKKNPIVVIDGCQYFCWSGYRYEVNMTHKGNCNNPIHVYNK